MARVARVRFGQLVVGPPGSGKTTYCRAMHQFLHAQQRPTIIVNLDPANDPVTSFAPEVTCSSLITVDDVMNTHSLGPNGALMYCMQFLEKNFDRIMEEIDKFPDHYVLFDLPGQVELYTHDRSVPAIIKRLEALHFRLVVVNLVDAHYCSDPGKYVSMLLTCLSTMLHLALPHVNVLSKLDLAERHGQLQFGLEFYTDVLDLERLLQLLDDQPVLARYRRLSAALADLVQRYGLVSFSPLAVEDRQLLAQLCQQLDRANGFAMVGGKAAAAGDSGGSQTVVSMLSCAVGAQSQQERLGHAADKYLGQEAEE